VNEKALPVKISGYIWREEVVDKLWWKHRVTVEEVQKVFANRPRVERVEKGHHAGEDVYIASGQTDAGRYLIVVFIYKLDHRALIITARDMTSRERRRYGKKK
jgi:uncharacterized DUF497 family protein